MDKSKIEHLNPQEYTHLPHADQHFEDHEQTDVAIRPLTWTLVAIVVVVVVTMIGLWGLFELLESLAKDDPGNQRVSQVELSMRQVPEGYPDLQGIIPNREFPDASNPNSPAQDMKEMRDRNVEILAGRAPMRPGGKNGMPIVEAMDQALSRGIFKTARPTTGPATRPATGDGAGETDRRIEERSN